MGTRMEETIGEPREEVQEARLIRRVLREKWGPGNRDARGAVHTSRGFGRCGLCLVLRPGKGTNGNREESPEEQRDPEHLDHYAAGGEGPGAQPHRAHPPGRDPGSRTPSHVSPKGSSFRLQGAASEQARTADPDGCPAPPRLPSRRKYALRSGRFRGGVGLSSRAVRVLPGRLPARHRQPLVKV